MKYWFDTEFMENGRTIDLISIGIVSEDERTFYAQALWADLTKASDWVEQNVIPHLSAMNLSMPDSDWMTKRQMRGRIIQFVEPVKYGKPEFWAYYADYDWVVLCQLFGTMMDLPKGWPKYCRDIKQWCDMLGNPALPELAKNEHHALADAWWNKKAWEFLANIEATKP